MRIDFEGARGVTAHRARTRAHLQCNWSFNCVKFFWFSFLVVGLTACAFILRRCCLFLFSLPVSVLLFVSYLLFSLIYWSLISNRSYANGGGDQVKINVCRWRCGTSIVCGWTKYLRNGNCLEWMKIWNAIGITQQQSREHRMRDIVTILKCPLPTLMIWYPIWWTFIQSYNHLLPTNRHSALTINVVHNIRIR